MGAENEQGAVDAGPEAVTGREDGAAARPAPFRLCSLVEGVLLGGARHIGALQVRPIAGVTLASAPAGELNEHLGLLQWPTRIPMEGDVSRHPAVVAVSTRTEVTPEQALAAHLADLDATLTAVAGLRGGNPSMQLTVIEREEGDAWRPLGVIDHRVGHGGNLLTGFLAGDDAALLERYASAARKPAVALWLTLAREAAREPTSEGKLFRYAQLLEILATAGDVADQPLDDEGAPLAWRSGSTKGVAGSVQRRILDLIRSAARQRQVTLASLLPPGVDDVWFTVRCIVAVRDAVAHHGGFELSSTAQQRHPWFPDVQALLQVVEGAETLLDPRDHLAMTARELTRLVLACRVDEALQS